LPGLKGGKGGDMALQIIEGLMHMSMQALPLSNSGSFEQSSSAGGDCWSGLSKIGTVGGQDSNQLAIGPVVNAVRIRVKVQVRSSSVNAPVFSDPPISDMI